MRACEKSRKFGVTGAILAAGLAAGLVAAGTAESYAQSKVGAPIGNSSRGGSRGGSGGGGGGGNGAAIGAAIGLGLAIGSEIVRQQQTQERPAHESVRKKKPPTKARVERDNACDKPVAALGSVHGDYSLVSPSGEQKNNPPAGTPLKPGMTVKTNFNSEAQVVFADNTEVRLGGESYFTISPCDDYDIRRNDEILVAFAKGVLRWISHINDLTPNKRMVRRLSLPSVVVTIRGTDFEVTIRPDKSGDIKLFSGLVQYSQRGNKEVADLKAGQMVSFDSSGRVGNPVPIDTPPSIGISAADTSRERLTELSKSKADAVASAAPAVAAPPVAADANAGARRDYELAAQVGTKEGWEAYLKQYQTGFYADLARAQLAKATSSEPPDRANAERGMSEKERLAREQAEREKIERERSAKELADRHEKERLAHEQAESARLEKERLAHATAERERLEKEHTAREQTERQRLEKERLVREQADRERLEKERSAQAEGERLEKEKIARERAERERLEKERIAHEQVEQKRLEQERLAREQAERQRLEQERIAREKTEREKTAADAVAKMKMAELTPPKDTPTVLIPSRLLAGGALIEEIKKELARVGCYTGPIDDKWTTPQTSASVKKFIQTANVSSTPNEPTMDFLNAVRGKPERICPLECGAREVESGGQCVAKTCAGGYELDADGDCVRQKAGKKSGARSGEISPPLEREPTGGGGRCTARSCSAAFNGCLRHSAGAGRRHGTHCSQEYASCMQTGTFSGRVCQLSGLARN